MIKLLHLRFFETMLTFLNQYVEASFSSLAEGPSGWSLPLALCNVLIITNINVKCVMCNIKCVV